MPTHAKDKEFIASVTAYGFTFRHFINGAKGKARRFVADTPSGIPYEAYVRQWREGDKPHPYYLYPRNIREEAESLGLTDVRIEHGTHRSDGKMVLLVKAMTPSGVPHEIGVWRWAKGARPPAWKMRDLLAKVAAEGLLTPHWSTRRWRKQSVTVVEADTPSGHTWHTTIKDWDRGSRPTKNRMRDTLAEMRTHGLVDPHFVRDPATNRIVAIEAETPFGTVWSVSPDQWIRGERPPRLLLRDVLAEALDEGCTDMGLIKLAGDWVLRGRSPHGDAFEYPVRHWTKSSRPRPWRKRSGAYHVENVLGNPALSEIPTAIYYARFDDPTTGERFWKIGISTTGRQRFGQQHRRYKVTTIRVWPQQRLVEALLFEEAVIKSRTEWHYKPRRSIGGKTECFSDDVLGFDNTEPAV